MDELKGARKDIDRIDKEIMELFKARMEAVKKIGQIKYENDMEIFDSKREKKVIENLKNSGRIDGLDYGVEFMEKIMDISKKVQSDMLMTRRGVKIGFQGVEGSYSEEALSGFFSGEYEKKSYDEFEDVVKAIEKGEIDYGVLPAENSSTGSITQIYDLLNRHEVYIVGEKLLKIQHNLMAKKGETIDGIRRVYSHPQGISQCSRFLKEYREWEKIAYTNTAKSAKLVSVSNESGIAAIGSRRAAQIYNLEILSENINNSKYNTTRFIIIGRKTEEDDLSNKISMMLTIPHKPGCLNDIIQNFAQKNINMLKIESRPMKDRPWEYYFYIDIEGNLNYPNVLNVVQNIQEISLYFKILGNYKMDKMKVI